jgi:cytochrome c oxidase subunit 2
MANERRFHTRSCLTLALLVGLGGCAGVQSALAPSGVAAREIAALWWAMAVGAIIIYVIVLGAAFYAVRIRPERHGPLAEHVLILGGGVILPVVVLSALLTYSFSLGPSLQGPVASDALRVEVIGKQWWWEVRYLPAGNKEPVISANELRIPTGEPVEVLLESTDVIHSFWVPSLAGKTDMIPGRTNRLVLQADRPGVYRGQCAEYCGGPHALMAFYVIAEPPEDFAAWLEREAQPAQHPTDPFLARGHKLFLDSGCGTCHAIRGTLADGRFGPDLTHVGGRHSLAAGILPNNRGTLAGWIADSQTIKPGNKMPSFNTFEGEALRALAAYLENLK